MGQAAKRRVAALKASHAAAAKGAAKGAAKSAKGAAAQPSPATVAAVKLGEDDAAAKKEIADYFASLDAQALLPPPPRTHVARMAVAAEWSA